MSYETNFGTHDTNHDLVVDALKYPTTEWQLWNGTKYTATVSEPITIEAATLRDHGSGKRQITVVTTTRQSVIDPSRKRVRNWAYDGEVMVELPTPDPQTGAYVRTPGNSIRVLRGSKCPGSVTIGAELADDPVTSVTFGGDLVVDTGVWELDANAFDPQDVTEHDTPTPFDGVASIVDYVREQSGLPLNTPQISGEDARNVYGLR